MPIKKHSFDGVDIYEYEELKLSKPAYMVLGLPDVGLVGAIATKYLTTSIGMTLVGEIDSPTYFQPISVVHKGVPYSPLQLYMNRDRNILALVAEAPIPAPAVYPIAKGIVEYVVKLGIDYIISLSGIAIPNRLEIQKPKVYWIASTSEGAEVMKKTELQMLDEGFIVGPYAIILKEARRRGIKNIVILVESFLDLPDPEASAQALMVLSKITGIQVDVGKLLEEAELLKLQTRELMKQTRRTMMQMQKGYEMHMPLMYT